MDIHGIINEILDLSDQVLWFLNFFGFENAFKLFYIESQNLVLDFCKNIVSRFTSRIIRQDEVLHYLLEFDFYLVVFFAEEKIVTLFDSICDFHIVH